MNGVSSKCNHLDLSFQTVSPTNRSIFMSAEAMLDYQAAFLCFHCSILRQSINNTPSVMHWYIIAQSFLRVTSILASMPFHVIRRQGTIATIQTIPITTAQTTAEQSPPTTAVPMITSNPVMTSSSLLSLSSPPPWMKVNGPLIPLWR